MLLVDFIKGIAGRIVRKRSVIVFSGLLLSVILPFFFIIYSPVLLTLDNKIYDDFLVSSKGGEPSTIPVVIDLDESSLDQYGQWPWTRYRVALLVDKIRRLGAAVVATDIVFSEPDKSSPRLIREELLKEMGVYVEFVGLPEALMDNDQILAGILKEGAYVLAFNLLFDETGTGCESELHPVPAVMVRTPNAGDPSDYLYKASGINCNLKILSDAVSNSGFFNTLPDIDGINRRSPLLIRYKNNYYPSLAIASLIRALGIKQLVLKLEYGAMELKVGEYVIPLDQKGNLLIHYKGPRKTFQYVSAADIMSNRLPKNALAGKIAILGTSSAGLKDLRSTPFDMLCPGVEIHATILDNILTGDYLSRPAWAVHLEVAVAFLVGIVSTLILTWAPPYFGLAVLGCGALVIWYSSLWLFNSNGFFISPLMPLIVLCVNFSGLSLVKFWREEAEKRYFHTAFSQYVSKSVVDQLVKSRDTLVLSGVEKDVTILFSDIRGFSSISEQMPTQRVSEFLRAYFTPMTRVVIENSGTLDKFIGDAVMAFWNAPLNTPDHQIMAVRAAMAMLKEIDVLNVMFKKRFGFTLRVGVGLNAGKVTVGNMGSEDLFDYTIIGDSVNLASRIEGLTKTYGLPLLVSDTIRDASVKMDNRLDVEFLEVDRVRVKGKDNSVTIHTVLSSRECEQREGEIFAYQQALNLYQNQEFEAAEKGFKQLVNENGPVKLYQLYQQRCFDLIRHPPGAEWDRIFTHSIK